MIAVAESVKDVRRDYVAGVGRSFRDGVRDGAGYQSEALVDIEADGLEFKGRSGLGKLIYCGGIALGEFFNAASFGWSERRSFYGKNDDLIYSSVDGDAEAKRAGLLEFIGKYEVKYGIGSDGAAEGGSVRRNRRLEDSVGGSEVRAAKGRTNAVDEYIEENGLGDDGDDYKAVVIDDEGNVKVGNKYNLEEAKKEADIMRERHTVLNLNAALDEADIVKRRMRTQEDGLAINIRDLRSMGYTDAIKRIEAGYMSTLAVPYVEGTHGGEKPAGKRKLADEEIRGLIDRIII